MDVLMNPSHADTIKTIGIAIQTKELLKKGSSHKHNSIWF